MIFVTVGSQLPFDRLVNAIDEWAGLNKETKVIVQAGETNFSAKHCQIKNYLEPVEWEKLLQEAEFIISHAGMGTILKCIDSHKPIIILPREWKLGEIRNDHQLATVKYFEDIPGVYVANTTENLFDAIKSIRKNKDMFMSRQDKNLECLISELKLFAS